MKKLLPLAVIIASFVFSIQAQTAPDAAQLTKLLKDFLAGASHNDVAMHERFWADDVIYTGSSGRRRGKAEIMKDVRSAPAPKPGDPATVYSAEDIRIQQYGNTAIVAFRLVATTEKKGAREVANYLNTGTFLKRRGKWQVVSWQATKMAAVDQISGEWKVTFHVHERTTPGTFTLQLDGDKITGSAFSDHTGAGTVRDGKWTDGKFSFTLDFKKHESIAIKGELKDGKLSGEFSTEGFSDKWEAVKK